MTLETEHKTVDWREASTSLRDLLKALHLSYFVMKHNFACSKHIMFQYPTMKSVITFNYFSLNTYKMPVDNFLSFLSSFTLFLLISAAPSTTEKGCTFQQMMLYKKKIITFPDISSSC
jgi:hypothetical protein